MVVLYVDDLVGIAYSNENDLKKFFLQPGIQKSQLHSRGHVHQLPRHQFHQVFGEWHIDPHPKRSNSEDQGSNWHVRQQLQLYASC